MEVVVAELSDRGALTELVRAALSHDVAIVPLDTPPRVIGRFMLQLRAPGTPGVSVAAEAAGTAKRGSVPLRLRPLDPSHVAELSAFIDEVSPSIAPPPLDQSAILDPAPPLPPPPPTSAEEAKTQPRPASPERPWSKTVPLGTQRPAEASSVPPELVRTSRRWRTPPPLSVGLGRIIANKYRLESVLGAGAVGAVYGAMHGDLGRTVAIKVLHPHCRNDPHLLAAFRKEARAASGLDHPNVTIVHDFGEEPDGLVYIVMEHLPGITLQAAIDQDKKLPAKRVLPILLQVCAALSSAHERGIVHRDVKPENVLLVQSRDDEGFPFELAKVCDFGIAAFDDAGLRGDLTAGTPEYMAPEQATGRSDPRTDVYACGVMLFEMLAGRPPFVGDTVAAVLAKHAQEAPPRLSTLVPVDARLEALVLRALEKQPERRFPTMREMRQALKRLQT